MNVNARRNELLRVLRNQPNNIFTAKSLAEDLSVTERTIRRDVQILQTDEHQPIDMIQGNGGGIRYAGNSKYGRLLSFKQVDALKRAIENNPEDADILRGIIETYA